MVRSPPGEVPSAPQTGLPGPENTVLRTQSGDRSNTEVRIFVVEELKSESLLKSIFKK